MPSYQAVRCLSVPIDMHTFMCLVLLNPSVHVLKCSFCLSDLFLQIFVYVENPQRRFLNNGIHERRNRRGGRSEGRNRNTESGKQGTPPTHENENPTSKEWPTPYEQRKYPKHLLKRRQIFCLPLRR